MSYNYTTERPWIFTEQGVKALLDLRKEVTQKLENSGAFMSGGVMGHAPDTWKDLALLDYLVEIGEIIEVTVGVAGQDRIFRGRRM